MRFNPIKGLIAGCTFYFGLALIAWVANGFAPIVFHFPSIGIAIAFFIGLIWSVERSDIKSI